MKNKFENFKDKPVAYFCAEYGFFDHTPFYAGGLGILAGDYIKAMIEQDFPAIAIGLYYHKEHQHGLELSKEKIKPEELGLKLLTRNDGSIVKVPIKIQGRKVMIQAWTYKKGQVNIYLLDTQLEENSVQDWKITDTLYVEDRYLRLFQEIVLGIGGVKLINNLKINPSVYHINEGHSAMISFELIKKQIRNGDNSNIVKDKIIFTNHTIVAAGQELFDIEIVKNTLNEIKDGIEIDIDNFIKLGYDENSKMFSMTNLALNTATKSNTVSKLHNEKAKDIWNKHDFDNVTNGINIENWDQLKYYSHKELKRKLLNKIKEENGEIFDENILLIGWARRFVEYKRPLSILKNIDRFIKLAKTEGREFRLVYSTFLNDSYDNENPLMKELHELINTELKGIVTFIPNYDINIARLMTSGCDIWLNTPIIGYEACGTSGMKACLNGVLPLSTNDGWINEVDLNNIGWTLNDEEDISNTLLDIIEKQIIGEYYDNKDDWKLRIKKSRDLIINQFNASRMLNDYIEKMYK